MKICKSHKDPLPLPGIRNPLTMSRMKLEKTCDRSWCLCVVRPDVPRDRFKFPIIPPSLNLSVRADICWWEKWTMVTIVTGHDSCQSHRRLPQCCGGTFTNLDWIRPTSNNCEVFIFIQYLTDRWIETIIAQVFNRGLVIKPTEDNKKRL